MASFNLLKLAYLRDFIPRTFELYSKNDGGGYSLKSFSKDCISGITV
jgi:SulP family sulfate permease